MTVGRRLLLATGVAIVGGCVFVDEPCACSPPPPFVARGMVVEQTGLHAPGIDVVASLFAGSCPGDSGGSKLVFTSSATTDQSGRFYAELDSHVAPESGCARVTASRAGATEPAVVHTQRVRLGVDSKGYPLDSVRVTLTLPAP